MRRLHAHQHRLVEGLDDILDVTAGLQEVLLQSRYDAAVDDLGAVLDVEAGLRSVLPDGPPPPLPGASAAGRGPGAAEDARWSVTASDRWALRMNPQVATAYHALRSDADLARGLGSLPGLARGITLEITRALGQDLELARNSTLVSYSLRLHAPDLELERVLERARSLANTLALGLERGGNATYAQARDLDRARALVTVLGRAGRHAGFVPGLPLILRRALDRAGDVARMLELADPAGGLPAPTVIGVRVAEVARAIGMVLGRRPPSFDSTSVHTFVNDFTTSDLRAVPLTGVDLDGVRWSETGTRWPAAVDVEELKARSEETPAHSGIWVVRSSGTAVMRDFADLG
ncbi:hypothetical protein [Streptomyces griseosporeus]|uniref:hypothetical protein n=1 Tax=Streptomyces griseosporeus TaxID=1910 RepID=UPI0037B4BD45